MKKTQEQEMADILHQRFAEREKDSRLWQVMVADGCKDEEELLKRNKDYERVFTLTNICYMLADVQDSCIRDLESITRRYGMRTNKQTRQTYNMVMNTIKTTKRVLGVTEETVKESGETKSYINGNADVIYDVVRMMIDRLARKKDVIHLVHLIRTMPNINGLFPNLDKGQYSTNF